MTKEENTMQENTWYPILGGMFKELLTPVGIHVDDNCRLTALLEEYHCDFLLVRCDGPNWTNEQYNRLPDFLRDNSVKHCVCLLTTENPTLDNLVDDVRLALGASYFYTESYNTTLEETHAYVLCTHTPTASTISQLDYEPCVTSGVYKSDSHLAKYATIVSLNELESTPQNAFLKTFATSQAEKKRAFAAVRRAHFSLFTHKLYWLMAGLWAHWLEEGHDMSTPPALPDILQKGKQWQDSFLW
jgi:hypothetical protein